MEATRGLPTQSTHPFIALCVAIAMLVVPATGGLAGSDNADTAPAADAAGTEAAALPYDGLVPAIEEHTDEHGDDLSFEQAIELGKLVGHHQASTFGLETRLDDPVPDHGGPAAAALALAELHDAAVSADQRQALAALDQLDEPVRSALTATIDAFIAFNLEADAAYGDPGSTGDHGRVSEARNHLLGAVGGLGLALDATTTVPTTGTADTCDPLVIAPSLALDLEGCDATYTEDVILSIDVGGDDTYHNNAGGAGTCERGAIGPIVLPSPGGAAALVDLGLGSDVYGDPEAPQACGANGGGYVGAGFLVDGGGDDTYHARFKGTNGGGNLGSGFLLDVAGDDTYATGLSGYQGANGGGFGQGSGALLDIAGNDTYTANKWAANGGGLSAGAGLLVDLIGDDVYNATDGGVNGEALPGFVPVAPSIASAGLLLDTAGTDTYEDEAGGAGVDKTVAPKGTVGAQIDVPSTPDPGSSSHAQLPPRRPAGITQEPVAPSSTSATSTDPPEACGARPLHPPIDIHGGVSTPWWLPGQGTVISDDEGPTGFAIAHDPVTGQPIYRPGSGVVSGSGTAEDPYVIEGWCIQTPDRHAAIDIQWTQAHVVIRDNYIDGTLDEGTWGAVLEHTKNVTFENNTVIGHDFRGLFVLSSKHNTIQGNHVAHNHVGIDATGSHDLTFRNNTMEANELNFEVSSSSVDTHTIDATNTVDGRPVIVLHGVRDHVIDASSNAGYVAVSDGVNVTVRDLNLSHNAHGVVFSNVTDSRIENVTISNVKKGIVVRDHKRAFPRAQSENVVIANNTIAPDLDFQFFTTGIDVRLTDGALITGNIVSQAGTAISVGTAWQPEHSLEVRDNRIHNNTWTYTDTKATGILVWAVHAPTTVADNTVETTDRGVDVYHPQSEVVIDQNIITRAEVGVNVTGIQDGHVHVLHNQIVHNDLVGVKVMPFDDHHDWWVPVDVHQNNLTDNGDYGVLNEYDNEGFIVNATENHWGASDGPSSPDAANPLEDPETGALADGTGDTVSEGNEEGVSNVRFDPWLTTAPE